MIKTVAHQGNHSAILLKSFDGIDVSRRKHTGAIT
jgi:hypothetical protein